MCVCWNKERINLVKNAHKTGFLSLFLDDPDNMRPFRFQKFRFSKIPVHIVLLFRSKLLLLTVRNLNFHNPSEQKNVFYYIHLLRNIDFWTFLNDINTVSDGTILPRLKRLNVQQESPHSLLWRRYKKNCCSKNVPETGKNWTVHHFFELLHMSLKKVCE